MNEFLYFFQSSTLKGMLIIIFLISLEASLDGWEQSSLKSILRPKRTQMWDIFSMLAYFTGFAKLLGHLFSLGLLAYTMNHSETPGLLGGLPSWQKVILVILLHDFLTYWNHRIFHEVGLFWPLHEFHHSSTQISVLTAYRNHPWERVFSVWIIFFPIYFLLGKDTASLFAFTLFINFINLFVHSRVDLTLGWLGKYVFVTPRFHHLHHTLREYQFRNFGFAFVFWDRLFGTYAAPSSSVNELEVGLVRNRYEDQSPIFVFFYPVVQFYYLCVKLILSSIRRDWSRT